VYSNWPEKYDAFTYAAVTGSGVHLRANPNTESEIVCSMSYNIVKLLEPPVGDGRRRRLGAGSDNVGHDRIRSRHLRAKLGRLPFGVLGRERHLEDDLFRGRRLSALGSMGDFNRRFYRQNYRMSPAHVPLLIGEHDIDSDIIDSDIENICNISRNSID
jgi:hypothetical protein